MDKKIEALFFDMAKILRGAFSYEEYNDICIYLVFLKYVLDNEMLPYDKDSFSLQRMFDRGELNEEALLKVSSMLEEKYGFPASSLVDLAQSYLRINDEQLLQDVTKRILKMLEDVSFKDQGAAVLKGLKNVLYSSALSFGRIMSEKISKKSLSLLIKLLIDVQKEDKFVDFTYGFGLSTLEITKDIDSEITGYEINRITTAIAIILLIISGKHHFKIHMQDTLEKNIERESFDKIVSMPPLGMKVRDVKDVCVQILNEFELPMQTYNMEIYMVLKSILALKNYGKAAIVVTPNLLFANTKAIKSIRKIICEKYLEAVIQLPALYYGTNISTVLLILSKEHKHDKIQLINASSNEFYEFYEKTKNVHVELTDAGIEMISKIYHGKQNINGISSLVDVEKIREKEYLLVPERYLQVEDKIKRISNKEINLRLEKLYSELRTMIDK